MDVSTKITLCVLLAGIVLAGTFKAIGLDVLGACNLDQLFSRKKNL